jgi:hypothetical protein
MFTFFSKSVLVLAYSAGALQHLQGVEKLLSPALGLGSTAPVTQRGYEQVAALKSDEEMKTFMRRLAAAEARVINGEGELNGVAPFYSGTVGTQDLARLQNELRHATWVAEGPGRTAPLSEPGYQVVAQLKSKENFMAFARRILDQANLKVADEGSFKGLVPYYDGETAIQSFEQLQHELTSAAWVKNRDEPEPLPVLAAMQVNKSISEELETGKPNHSSKVEQQHPAEKGRASKLNATQSKSWFAWLHKSAAAPAKNMTAPVNVSKATESKVSAF